jgi:hypothetical protein
MVAIGPPVDQMRKFMRNLTEEEVEDIAGGWSYFNAHNYSAGYGQIPSTGPELWTYFTQ